MSTRASPVIELKGATLKFFKGIPSRASESSLRPQFAKLEQWQPFEIWGQNTIFGGHYLAVFEITAFFSALNQLFCFPTKPVTKLVFRDFFQVSKDFILHVFPRSVQKLSNQAWICFYKGQMRMLSGKLRVTKAIQWDSVFWVLGLTFSMEICQAPIKDQSWTKNH